MSARHDRAGLTRKRQGDRCLATARQRFSTAIAISILVCPALADPLLLPAGGLPFMDGFESGDLPPQDQCLATPNLTPFPMAEFADCAAAGLLRDSICGPSSICVQAVPPSGSIECRDLCATSEGPLGSSNHPDCRRAIAVCTDIGHLDFGLCE